MNLRVAAVLSAVVLSFGASASAAVKTFTGSVNANWSNSGNWSPSGVPTEADRAVIPHDKSCQVDINNAEADSVEIQESGGTRGTLQILPDCRLTLDNDDENYGDPTSPDHSLIDGYLNVGNGSVGDGTLVFVANNHLVSGIGRIHLLKGSLLDIGSSIVLSNYLGDSGEGMRGEGEISAVSGTCTLSNLGLVEAEGLLILDASTVLSDGSGSVWGLRCGGELRFNREAIGLLGDITNFSSTQYGSVSCNQDVRTCGTFTVNNGGVTVANGKTFRYRQVAGTIAPCGNPSQTTATVANTCGVTTVTFYSVTSSVGLCCCCQK